MASRLLSLFSAAYGDPTDEEGIEQRLRDAAERGELNVLQRLLPANDDGHAARVQKYGVDLLLSAVARDDQPMVDYLVSVVDASILRKHRQELLRSAIVHGNAYAIDRLASEAPETASQEEDDPLVLAAVRQKLAHDEAERVAKMQSGGLFARLTSPWEQSNGPSKSQKAEDVVARLLRNGVNANAIGDGGNTALHLASRSPSGTSVVVLLLRFGAATCLHVENDEGLNPLHEAIQARNVEVVKLLLNAGADPAVPTKSGKTPLQLAIFPNTTYRTVVYNLAHALVAYGRATWDSKCETSLAALANAAQNTKRTRWDRGSHWEDDTRRSFAGAIRVCINQWVQDGLYGMPFTSVPMEVLHLGEIETATYIKTMKTSRLEDVVHRRKVCVVGPSEWGKTSLVKSIVSGTPSLVHADDDRTIGIDLFGYAFTDESRQGSTNYEVTFWDFAGQDIYQVAHTLFFSKRTLFLVCVDLKAYADTMKEARALPSAQSKEALMQRFVTKNILHWIRLIFVRQPDAEFVVVGTKCDCLRKPDRNFSSLDPVQRIWRDLRARVGQWKRNLMSEIDEAIRSATDTCPTSAYPAVGSFVFRSDKTQLQDLKARIHTILTGEWIVVSAAKVEAVHDACALLEKTIARPACGFAMPTAYSEVLKAIHARRDQAANLDARQRIQQMIIPSHALCEALVEDVDGVSVETCQSILRTLRELGDILWYEVEMVGILQDYVILDPTIVLDIVRQVVNHNHIGENETSNGDGRVDHSNLLKTPLWKELDAELILSFKSLLHYFQLAYPADNHAMDWDSDLIVPAYWKTGKRTSDAEQASHSDNLISTTLLVCWEYDLSSDMSEIVFENVAVLSHTPFAQRRVEQRSFEAIDKSAGVIARVSLQNGEMASRDLLRIEAGSRSGDSHAAWSCARYYVMTMEYVLEAYPGLMASRYLVAFDPLEKKQTRHRLNDVIKTCNDAMIMGKHGSDVQALLPWVPPGNLQWFIEKAWRRPSMLSEMRARDVLDDTNRKMDVLRKLVTADKSRRQYPALWTLEYSGTLVTVKMLSDVSGDCFHEPIQIEVPGSFWVSHGTKIHRGLSIISTVLPEAVSLGVINKVTRLAALGLEAKVERAIQVHNAIDQLGLSSSKSGKAGPGVERSASGAVALLRDLLVLQDPNFNELKISRITNLQCATTADGAFVWAHREEIAALANSLTPCDPFDGSIALTDHAQSESGTENVSQHAAPLEIDPASIGTTKFQLRISEIGGLAHWDWRKLYCKWEIIRTSVPGTPVASGVTPPQPSNTYTWGWSLLAFPITTIASVDMLRECRLVVEVKRPSRCPGVVKSIGQGFIALTTCINNDDKEFGPAKIRVALEEKSTQAKATQPARWVSCEITISPPAASA